ncbi:uncharacterized protein LOC18436925 isoform X1 [Amborella trichopoda]|uniref:uncharacterized protein LOC18436925 isoform X1 n=1 Tax=Amborella trichopoda TaxID=13333 RepID=UPI0005D39365|nr:uncharacterized protein LOC18436925 isoform X1 [Amborella trichopoda]|eukprot:XP_011624379.1 uncharacterized protein LOC18436925 isoform X1 [Amborella trichopoda]
MMESNKGQVQPSDPETKDAKLPSSGKGEALKSSPTLDKEIDKEGYLELCRVCQCAEPDQRGTAALGFLNITPPSMDVAQSNDKGSDEKEVDDDLQKDVVQMVIRDKGSNLVEFRGPDGEIFICGTDVEAGSYHHQDALISLGCSCKNDLALAHYACALKWFISHGSTVCEICASVAKNVRSSDFNKVMASLKDCERLRERTAAGEVTPANVPANVRVDPDAVAAIRRQRLTEISMWFNPQNNSAQMSVGITEQNSSVPAENPTPIENSTAKWAVEGTAILLATGLLTITLAWLIAPHVGKKTAKSGLHILLGGLCALTVSVFFRFVVLPRIKYGPARYWLILFVFWFLVFGIWASRTRGTRKD